MNYWSIKNPQVQMISKMPEAVKFWSKQRRESTKILVQIKFNLSGISYQERHPEYCDNRCPVNYNETCGRTSEKDNEKRIPRFKKEFEKDQKIPVTTKKTCGTQNTKKLVKNYEGGADEEFTLWQTWNKAQACKQCLCKIMKYCVNFQDFVAIYIENPQKGLCKADFADFDCVN